MKKNSKKNKNMKARVPGKPKGNLVQASQEATAAGEEFAQELTMLMFQARVGMKALVEKHFPKYYSLLDQSLTSFNYIAPSPITCENKCTACCYLMVSISPIQAVYMWHYIRKHLSIKDIERIKKSLQECYDKEQELAEKYPNNLSAQAREYQELNIPCAFLGKDKQCKAYAFRPMICRYHCVMSPPALCSDPDGVGVKVWKHPSMVESDTMFQQFLSKAYLDNDKMDTMPTQLLRYAEFSIKNRKGLEDRGFDEFSIEDKKHPKEDIIDAEFK